MTNEKKLIDSDEIEVNGRNFPIEVYLVSNRSSSVRIRNGKVIIKLSRYTFGFQRKKIVNRFMGWALKRLKKFKERDFINPIYKNGARICMHNKCYDLVVKVEDRKNNRVEISEYGEIIIRLSEYVYKKNGNELIKDLAEKAIIKDQLDYLKLTIDELNQLHFQELFNSVRFRRSNARFGSCSAKGNINISFRLLFAPREVFRYVCVHELAHLKEFNHSKRFWALVKEAMPDYKEQEVWLKMNGFMLG